MPLISFILWEHNSQWLLVLWMVWVEYFQSEKQLVTVTQSIINANFNNKIQQSLKSCQLTCSFLYLINIFILRWSSEMVQILRSNSWLSILTLHPSHVNTPKCKPLERAPQTWQRILRPWELVSGLATAMVSERNTKDQYNFISSWFITTDLKKLSWTYQ